MFLFYCLCIIHIFIWLFIVFGSFINKNCALFNLIILIPFIYLLHIFPFHVINHIKCLININCLSDTEKIEKFIKFFYIKKIFDDFKSFQNPLSPQGLLILGYIINFYCFYFKYSKIKK